MNTLRGLCGVLSLMAAFILRRGALGQMPYKSVVAVNQSMVPS